MSTTKLKYKPLTIPQIKWETKILTNNYGELVAQPLEPGFGITLGNALRRVLLAAIEGSAVTSVIIKGVNNEFSLLPGIKEDVMQILLNIKEIVIKNNEGIPGKMRLHISGESVARASDIECDEHLEIINKDHVIATLSKNAELDIEFFVESQRGYVAAQWPIGSALQEDNRIYLDAMFSPVTKVNFDVEKTRVGKSIDYDKLILKINTNGSESPADVLHYSVSVLRTQLEHFLVSPEIAFNQISENQKEEKVETISQAAGTNFGGVDVDLLLKPVDELELSARAHNCLISAGKNRIIDLVNLNEDELLKVKNFGRKSLREVKEALKSLGLSLGMNIKEEDIKKQERSKT